MNYRNLGRTGVKVSPLCLGTMNFGYRTPRDEAIEITHQAIDRGINFIDTADFYGQPMKDGKGQGLTEEILGDALQGKRERIILATKCVMPTANYPDDPNAMGTSRRHIIKACEDSLRRLQTDYIDLYQLHRPMLHIAIDESLRALDDLVRSGKVRYIGTSSFPAWLLVESYWVAKEWHLNRFVTEQPKYHLLNREVERDVVSVLERYEMAMLPYSPLAGGLLTGKYKRGEEPPSDSRLKDEAWGRWAQSFATDTMYDVLDILQDIATEKEATIAQIATAWLMKQATVASVIIGPRTMAQLEDYLNAINIELSDVECQRIAEIT